MKRLNCQRLCTYQRNEPLLGHGKIQSGNHQKGIDLIAKQSRKYYRENSPITTEAEHPIQ